jgi:hypothetical protein
MKRNHSRTVELGELIAVVFDIARQYSVDKREISLLATGAVTHMLRNRWQPAPPSLATQSHWESFAASA